MPLRSDTPLSHSSSVNQPTLLHHMCLQGLTPIPDLAAFAVIIGFGLRNGLNASAMAMSRPGIVKTIVQDATIYFIIIFTSHLVFVLTLVFARVRVTHHNGFVRFLTPIYQPVIQLLPAVGNDVFLPIMISRLMLSLKKVASTDNGWSFAEMTAMRRTDELGSVHFLHEGHTRPSFDEDRAQKGFRVRGPEGPEGFLTDDFEEIGMGITRDSEELR